MFGDSRRSPSRPAESLAQGCSGCASFCVRAVAAARSKLERILGESISAPGEGRLDLAGSVKTPCIDICVFDTATGWCVGCGRTRPEVAQWRKLTPFRRKAIERDLPRRTATLVAAAAATNS
ncbi:DUF1289 domain-containing protein [Brevundimonas staleyi]|uniref:DUF1289 domain-containing protein n=1 Tax=Brevundimonas staleyi TaxID=74326 RepID=A0ABW0FRS6_9CAUL|nr:DUF1289 domain-containing protein [Brevundimonas diminuta]